MPPWPIECRTVLRERWGEESCGAAAFPLSSCEREAACRGHCTTVEPTTVDVGTSGRGALLVQRAAQGSTRSKVAAHAMHPTAGWRRGRTDV
jgi:hypothetical protein